MKKQTGYLQKYIVLITIGEQQFFIKYDYYTSRYIKVEYDGRHAEKFSLEQAYFARRGFVEDLGNEPYVNPQVTPFD
jgi:hypothetical protein